MRQKTEAKRIEVMEKCFDCFCENGIKTGVNTLAQAAGVSTGTIFLYFGTIDNLIIEATAYCMEKVENDFMEMAPKHLSELDECIGKVPYWTAERHGKKFRFMYQVYAAPKYLSEGKRFFEGATKRYAVYANELADNLQLSQEYVFAMILFFVRMCVHYAMFGGEKYLQAQLNLYKAMLEPVLKKP